MVYSSLAVLAMSASALVNPFTNLVHMHPKAAQPDTRVSVVLYNNAPIFRDVKIDGHIYTVDSHRTLTVTAPKGTVVYAASPSKTHHRGDAILEIQPELKTPMINID